jgi:hypothetical protein
MQFDLSRCKHFTAMALIGDGIMGMIHPCRDSRAWQYGPKPWQNLMHSLEEHPNLTRLIGAAQVVGGVLWVLHSEEKMTTTFDASAKEAERRIA